MSHDLRFSNLCRLIDDSFRFYIEPEVLNLTKDKEQDLLIILSKVFRDIQIMKLELDCSSDDEEGCDRTLFSRIDLDHGYRNCLIKILADLMIILTIENNFVQHLVGNILFVVSEFLVASGSEWDFYIHSLFMCLKLAISNVSSHSLAPSINGDRESKCDLSTFVLLKSRLVNANWSTAAAIIRVLRSILKYLKQVDGSEFLELYFGSVSSFLLDVPWDIMGEIQGGQSNESKESDSLNSHFMDTLFVRNDDDKQKRIVFLGAFIQFLCSLVEQSCDVKSKVGSQDHHPLLCLIASFVPKLLSCCLGEQGISTNMSVSHYFRHKLLMLMLRLSYRTSLGYSTLILWLQLLHDYFEVLLRKPIIKLDFTQDESLEGSPFLLNLPDGVNGINSCHMQRWAILLFLRCCFEMISLTRDTSNTCTYGTCNYCSSHLNSGPDHCAKRIGFLELYKWLQWYLPVDISVGSEIYFEKCRGFTLSFLQLFVLEDDVLFKVLLQLLSIHSFAEQESNGEKWTAEDVNKDILIHISQTFNPVYTFHLFLAELHHDHQVLLDYLISKDTGISCAEYLLRCLRTVCNSWHLFMTFPMREEVVSQLSCKRRKIFLDASNLQVEASSAPVSWVPSSLEEEAKKNFEYSQYCKTRRNLFKAAKNCLLSLKYSVENLQRKSLFPYNPEVLLKRLRKFEELCIVQKN